MARIQNSVGADGRPDRRSVLLSLGELLRAEVELDVLLARAVDLVARAMQADRATLFVLDPHTGELVSRAAHLPELLEIRLRPGQGIAGHVAQTRAPVNIPHADDHPKWEGAIDQLTGYKTQTLLCVPVLGPAPTAATFGSAASGALSSATPGVAARPLLGVLQVLNKRRGPGAAGRALPYFDDQDRDLLLLLSDEVAVALLTTALPQRVTGRGKERYNRIVGSSAAMRRVYEIIARAAATTATVLVRGESGTGKELVARAIHVNSSRAQGPFVKIDCTAIPEGLMETELFGHEKGAFTGADRQVPGKVELAHGGTLFLDEIGDLKAPLQGKLLRLLQDREFERVGGRKTLAVDLRVVAATHRDLAEMVHAGTFRADLYYRLKVVELELPSLRARGAEDIERLACHFVDLYARKHKKPVRGLSDEALRLLSRHGWPGNIRELEHCLESAVALCAGVEIQAGELPLPQAVPRGAVPVPVPAPVHGHSHAHSHSPGGGRDSGGDGVVVPDGLTLEEVERRYVARALERSAGNRSEAARSLGIGRNTLLRKLKELKLDEPRGGGARDGESD